MTNTKLLKAKIVENGYTQTQLAQQMGISYQTLNSKINNKIEFKASEIDTICKLLKIVDMDEIFFCI